MPKWTYHALNAAGKDAECVKEAEDVYKRQLKEFRPDVVIGTGGYASAPIMKAAQKMDIPTYVHEQNAVPGMANKLLEKNVKKLFLGC